MNERVGAQILGLPSDFALTLEEARTLNVDAVLAGISLRHGLFEAGTRLIAARQEASDLGHESAENALQLLILVCQLGYGDEPRTPFIRTASGHFEDGSDWYTPLPEDLSESHVLVLETLLESIATTALRAKLADVLWHRRSPRNVGHAREAVSAYIDVAKTVFNVDEWVDSEQQFSRAFRIAVLLGPQSPELQMVLSTAREFLRQLDGNDKLYYTERIIDRILPYLEAPEAALLLQRVESIALNASSTRDFDRSRTYYELAARLARHAGRDAKEVQRLRIDRAETFLSEAAGQPNETGRSISLRLARQALLDAGASRERIAEAAQLLEEAQRLSVNEMTPLYSTLDAGIVPDAVRTLLRDVEPIEAMWRLAGLPILQTASRSRQLAEEMVSRYVFAFGFGRRHLSRDGRQQGMTPGSIGSDDREDALRGAMRFNAAQHRIHAVFAAIDPGRSQLRLQHEYTLAEVYEGLRARPFIPHGHLLLFSKGIHAGLLGEFDIATHLLAPQLENALREILRRHGSIVYSTNSEGVQSLLSLENVLDHAVSREVLGEDYIFAIETTFSERLGANIRNDVAHGLLNDSAGNGIDAVFAWWLVLRLLRAYGPDPIARSADDSVAAGAEGGHQKPS